MASAEQKAAILRPSGGSSRGLVLLASAVFVALACGSPATAPDGSSPDAATRDAGARDAAARDVGTRDAAARDAARPDAMVPAAILGLAVNEWGAVSRNTLADVNPCPGNECAYSAVEGQSGVINDWNGGALASEEGALGGLVYWGGGHNGYYGNEVYFFDFESLMWERRSEPTDGMTPGDSSTFGPDSSTGLFWDGRPIPVHTYDAVAYHPSSNAFMILTSADAPSRPPALDLFWQQPYAHRFTFDDATWTAGGQASAGAGDYLATAYDASRDLFWVWPATGADWQLSSYDANTDRWAVYRDDEPHGIDHVGAIDPTRDLFVIFGSDGVIVKDLSAPDAAGVTVTTTGDTAIEASVGVGFEWCPPLSGFLSYAGGMSLYLLTPPSGAWATETWSWRLLTATGSDPGPAPEAGVYSKFQYADSVGAAFVSNGVGSPVYAFRVR